LVQAVAAEALEVLSELGSLEVQAKMTETVAGVVVEAAELVA